MVRTYRTLRRLENSPLHDPDLGPLVEMFVSDLPERIEQLRGAGVDADALVDAALHLEEALESYGLDDLVPSTRRIVDAANQNAPREQINAAVDDLAELCQRMGEV